MQPSVKLVAAPIGFTRIMPTIATGEVIDSLESVKKLTINHFIAEKVVNLIFMHITRRWLCIYDENFKKKLKFEIPNEKEFIF